MRRGGWRILGRITWFSGGTEGRSVVVNRVQVEDYRKLTGGIIRISIES